MWLEGSVLVGYYTNLPVTTFWRYIDGRYDFVLVARTKRTIDKVLG